jgi:hypothetical protein
MSFHSDLERGLEIEKKVLKIVHKKYPKAEIVTALKEYDIWVPELNKSIEVKYDPMSCQTGNIVVEFEMNGKPSALMATTADWWVFYDDEVFFFITPKEIIYLIFGYKLTHVQFIGSGDRTVKKAFLIPKDWLIAASRILEDHRF